MKYCSKEIAKGYCIPVILSLKTEEREMQILGLPGLHGETLLKRREGKGKLACAYNPSTWKAETGLGQCWLNSEFQASLGYSIIRCLKKSGGRFLNHDHSPWEIQMQVAWRVLCVGRLGLHILRDSLNKHSLTDWQLIAHCIHGNSGTLLPTDSIFKKYYIFTLILLLASEYEIVTLPEHREK